MEMMAAGDALNHTSLGIPHLGSLECFPHIKSFTYPGETVLTIFILHFILAKKPQTQPINRVS